MSFLKIFSICLVALGLHGAAWAQIYETTDADGNPVFTDSSAGSDSELVKLPETNIADAPQPESQPEDELQPDAMEVDQQPLQEDNTVIVHDNNDDEVYDEYLARERAFERKDPAAPREVGDSDSQMPHEVGDSDSQMPHEVGDFPAEMPREVGDFPAERAGGRR